MRLLGVLLAFALIISGGNPAKAKPVPIKIVLEKRNGKPVAYIDGRLITSRPYYSDLAAVLLKIGRKHPVWVLVDDRLPINEMGGIIGELQAVGFTDITLFLFNRESGRMKLIGWHHLAVAIPFPLPKR